MVDFWKYVKCGAKKNSEKPQPKITREQILDMDEHKVERELEIKNRQLLDLLALTIESIHACDESFCSRLYDQIKEVLKEVTPLGTNSTQTENPTTATDRDNPG